MRHRRLAPPLATLALVAPVALSATVSLPTAQADAPATTATAASTASSVKAPKVSTIDVPAVPVAQRRAVTVAPDDDSPATAPAALPQQAVVAERATKDFGLVGVTWKQGTGQEDVRVQVRTRSDGTWSGWTDLHVDTDTDGPSAAGTRAGTEPLWAGDADGVAARVLGASGKAPQDVDLVLVDPGAASTSTASARTATAAPAAVAASAPTYTGQPAGIISRAGWGARGGTKCDSPVFGTYESGVIFHHTAGSNSYTKAQSAGIVRSIQAFHMDGRGWCDIGYNFLIDKYGQMFEGRGGSVRKQVRGAHAGNYDVNTYATGVSMMANLDTAQPTAAMKSAAVRLIGWRIGTFYLPATGTYGVANGRLQRVSGHRDVYKVGIRPATSTACPGKYGYAWLNAKGGLRDQVASYVSNYSTPNRIKARQLGVATTGNVFEAEYPDSGGYVTRMGRGVLYSQGTLGSHWIPSGPVLAEYGALGNQRGVLGFPGGEIVPVGSTAYQRYKFGTIYRVSSTKAWGLTGQVDLRYRQLNSLAGKLGTPTSRVVTSGVNQSATFTGGTIVYNTSTQAFTVTYK
ncbi:hypothetical protein GCM10011519_20660 [Marmoricola endophyticus]|uniref:N-acetylmuramoyl-L-alanine amidase n=1 Tax=Marmoricola endophyticus TaxID=2040280 RepID=A0A917F425_9ACTN|nr:peptidoglycan recognition protein [Marmoricola endophyticus]GGF46554.1 hypothetical protein GCM10011519_20660 [Marmoricola endophyticus]